MCPMENRQTIAINDMVPDICSESGDTQNTLNECMKNMYFFMATGHKS